MFLFSRLKTRVKQQEWQLLQFPLQDFLSSFLSLWQDFFSDFSLSQHVFSVLQQSCFSESTLIFEFFLPLLGKGINFYLDNSMGLLFLATSSRNLSSICFLKSGSARKPPPPLFPPPMLCGGAGIP